jgi:predicted nucleic acid-binding protein
MIAVLDSSVALRWFAPDGDALDAIAERVLRDIVAHPAGFVVPELFFHEVLAVLCLRMMQAKDARRGIERLARLGLRRVRLDDRIASTAVRLAYRHRLSGYDACYAALAVEFDGEWLTLDEAAHNRVAQLGISRVPS